MDKLSAAISLFVSSDKFSIFQFVSPPEILVNLKWKAFDGRSLLFCGGDFYARVKSVVMVKL